MSIRQDASIYNIENLPWPDKDHNLEMLLARSGATSLASPGFETEEWCRREDARRAAALKQASARADWPDTSEREDYLDSLLGSYAKGDDPGDLSRASATCMRDQRLRFFGAVLDLIRPVSSHDIAWVTASDTTWQFSMRERYFDENRFDVPRVFRSLLRIGGVMTAPGFLIMYLHAQYDVRGHFQLQFRGACAGEKLKRFRSLPETIAAPENEELIRDYLGASRPSSVYIGAQVPTSFTEEISKIMPNGVTPRLAAERIPSCGAPEPHHSIYLLWSHLYRSEPMIVMSEAGINDDDGHLVLTQQP